jgi:hypothetical protein
MNPDPNYSQHLSYDFLQGIGSVVLHSIIQFDTNCIASSATKSYFLTVYITLLDNFLC